MAINALSYLGVHSEKLEDWQDFSCKLLGMQNVDRGKKTLSFRMDNQKQRLAISGEAGDTLAFIGWEVENKSDLDEYARKLNNANYNVNLGSKNLCDKRFVEDLIFFNDPSGNRIELVFKPLIDKDPLYRGDQFQVLKQVYVDLGMLFYLQIICKTYFFFTEIYLILK